MSAALEELIGKIRAIAVVRGEAWLREKVAEILPDEGQESQDPPPCAKRGRALERRSPSPVPRNRPKLSSKDPPEVSGGPRPASEGPCPAENPFSLGSDSRDASHKYGNKGLRIPVKAASQHGSGNRPSSEVAGAVSAENQKSSSDFSSSLNRRTVKAESCDKSNNRKVSATSHSSNTEVESIELRIERLLQRCSEIQQEEDEPPEPTPAPVSSSVTDHRPRMVWIVGNSFVAKALAKVSLIPDGRQLGFPLSKAIIRWLGHDSLTWDCVTPTLTRYSCSEKLPDILVIHAGGDDIYYDEPISNLIRNIQFDLSRFMRLFPAVVIVWSQIVCRRRCPQGMDRNLVHSNCFMVNLTLSRYLEHQRAVVVHHRGLEGEEAHLFEKNGVCLSSEGNEVWCTDIKEGIDKALKLWHS
ncbi:uncharacterized protein ACNLHF_000668 isoform 2-T2 [Anomaloglossus baeobatrachus]|uniref:uncharacterized protein LOC142251704 isoform X2 n=1 Tax=Anomaloglossus baeobatrachus TaxID=238106 RepID=UPI003F50484B